MATGALTTTAGDGTFNLVGGNMNIFAWRRRFAANREGVTMVEYALIAALVAIAAVTILATLGTTVSGVFSTVNSNMS